MMLIDPALAEQVSLLEKKGLEDGVEKFGTGAAIVHDGKILVVTRNPHDGLYGGYAELPGGGVDEGETILEGLVRETLEETGMKTKRIVRLLGSFDYRNSSEEKLVRQFNFLIEPESVEVTLNPAEHVSYFWFDPAKPEMFDTVQISEKMKEVVLAIRL
jgi:8-oxo-dGTP pyrophosphatase MutT (NUDIX family)